MIHSNSNQNDICFKYDTCNVQNYSTDSYYTKNLYSVTDNDFFNSAGPGFEYDRQAGTVSSVEDTSCQGNYYNENFCSVTGSDFFNFAGLGFEYDPQASNVVSSVEGDTSCCGNWSWCDQTRFHNDSPYTQPIIRLYTHENLHSHTAIFTNGVDHEVDPSVYTCKGSSSNPAICSPNCTMNVTNFSCFHDGNWVPVVHLQGRDKVHLNGFYLWNQSFTIHQIQLPTVT